LKEKEEHVEQLLLERDLERSEIARSTARNEEVSGRYWRIFSHIMHQLTLLLFIGVILVADVSYNRHIWPYWEFYTSLSVTGL